MTVSDFAVNRSTTVFVLLGLILVAGLVSYSGLPREAQPEVSISIITVSTVYPGVSPSDMETLITIPIERELTGLDGVEEMTSTSVEGVSSVTIEFDPNVDIDSALQKVRDKVNMARNELPDEAEEPVIREVNMSEAPVMFVSITGDVGLPMLSNLAEDMKDRIETLKGVLEVNVVGDVEREIQVILDPERITQYGVSLATLVNLLQLENVNTPGGSMDFGEAKYSMRVPGEFSEPEELERLVVKRGNTGVVYLSDIATIRDGFKEIASISRVNGRPAITLNISKRSGESVITVTDAVHKLVEEMNPTMPAGVELLVTMDQSNEIREQVAQLENNILSGLVLVLGIILIFIGFANAIFVSLAIPISMLITFIAFAALDISLNIIVLFSLMLALGMLVDNAIVVVENIYRHAQEGLPPVEAAKKGAGEVAVPVIASTATTIAAFAPLFFWPGIMGKMMRFLPTTLTLILLASLFVGLVVNPALASVFMRARERRMHSKLNLGKHVISTYERFLRFCLRWRVATATAAFTTLFVITAIFVADVQVIFLPEVEPFSADIAVEAPEGTSLDTTDRLVAEVEAILEPHRDYVNFVVANVGGGGSGRRARSSGGVGSSHKGNVNLYFPPFGEFEVPPSAILEEVRPALESIVGVDVRISKHMHRPPTGPAVNVELIGDEFDELNRLRQEVRRRIAGIPGLVDMRDDFDKGKPEVRVAVDRERAWLTGLNTQTVGLSVRAAIDGRKAGEYREAEEEYDVMVRFPEQFKENIANVESMTLVNDRGDAIPFSAVASLEQGQGLGAIKHIDRKRTITISADAEGRSNQAVLADAKRILDDIPLPPGYTYHFTGEEEDMGETQGFLGIAFVVGLFLIALILITQFNSIVQPMIILSSVILSLAGVFLGLTLFDMPFGAFMTGLGCISLAGIVVNNAIVLIDFINQERKAGTELIEAIVRSGITRFRPVVLTAITTILGLIPMAVGISYDFRRLEWVIGGPSSQYWGSMAVAICFGLTFATVLTLIVVPVLYSLSESAAAFVRGTAKDANAQPIQSSGALEPVAK